MHRSLICLAAVALPLMASTSPAAAQSTDPYIWLEEVESPEALAWAEARNAETRARVRAFSEYQALYDESIALLTSSDRLALPTIGPGEIRNFWNDSDNPRGILRTASWESYLSGDPAWETILDVDALSEVDGVPWAFKGLFNEPLNCYSEDPERCLLSLSRGGGDATVVREFHRGTGDFVEGGFEIPEGKTAAVWVDEDHLLVATAAPGFPVTTSGYASTVRLWERGTPLASAPVVFEATESDTYIVVSSERTPDGRRPVISRAVDFFNIEQHLLDGESTARIHLPLDATVLYAGDHILVRLVSSWSVGGTTYPAGALVAVDFDSALTETPAVELLIDPDDRSTIQDMVTTRSSLYVNVLTDVQARLHRFQVRDGEWTRSEVEIPSAGAVSFQSRSDDDERLFFLYSSFLQPTTLFLVDEDGVASEVDRLPAEFDADGMVVRQHWATSADGTEVPYFVVMNERAPMDGTNPTLLTAYGGFNLSRTPGYLGRTGKLWAERGGVYVLANIRGGGEFGPEWWQAALREERQRAYDDFIAVSEDLIARGITSPAHLGIQGGSNGGLLVGAAMTQRPDLYNAVISAVPLLDMRRYHYLLAGASWVAEYGNPDVPEDWAFIREYSPYQNLEEGVVYPEPLIWTTTRDDRVHPGHARKMAEKMRRMGLPVMYFENTEGGHGSGVTPEQTAEIDALTMSYLLMKLRPRMGA